MGYTLRGFRLGRWSEHLWFCLECYSQHWLDWAVDYSSVKSWLNTGINAICPIILWGWILLEHSMYHSCWLREKARWDFHLNVQRNKYKDTPRCLQRHPQSGLTITHTIDGKSESQGRPLKAKHKKSEGRETRSGKWVYLATQLVWRKIPSKQRGLEQQGLFKYILTHRVSLRSHRCV